MLMRVLVTGANGFVGRRVIKRLRSANVEVIAAMRDPHPMPPGVKVVQIKNIGGDTDWREALDGVDGIVHLAARVHVMNDKAHDPLNEFRKVNLSGTRSLAEAAVMKAKRIVFVSSIKVNGERTLPGHPFSEKNHPHPHDPYAISKWEAEEALREISRTQGLEHVVLRPPLVYGPGVKANFQALIELIRKYPILPLGGIKNLRSMLYVDNLADAIFHCLNASKAANQTYLLKDGEDLSTTQLVERIAHHLHKKPLLLTLPKALWGVAGIFSGAARRLGQSLCVDDSKIRHDLIWQAPYSVDQGLIETLKKEHG